jgi:hypothetical protein
MRLSIAPAVRVYQQCFFGIDRFIGSTLDDETAEPVAVDVPENIRWYVRHYDDQIADRDLSELLQVFADAGVPGLSLASCRRLSPHGIAMCVNLPKLKTLDLFNTQTNDEVLRSLGVLRVGSLNLAGTVITDEGLQHLAENDSLEQLHLGWTAVTDRGCQALLRLENLRALDLRGTKITDAGAALLAGLPHLEALVLEETAVSSQVAAALQPLATRLRHLNLAYTAVGDSAIDSLRNFSELRTLNLRATSVSRTMDGQLTQALVRLGGVDTGPESTQEGLIR